MSSSDTGPDRRRLAGHSAFEVSQVFVTGLSALGALYVLIGLLSTVSDPVVRPPLLHFTGGGLAFVLHGVHYWLWSDEYAAAYRHSDRGPWWQPSSLDAVSHEGRPYLNGVVLVAVGTATSLFPHVVR